MSKRVLILGVTGLSKYHDGGGGCLNKFKDWERSEHVKVIRVVDHMEYVTRIVSHTQEFLHNPPKYQAVF